MNTRKVTIIVPVYNAEKTIERCVRSIQNQTYKNIEIILVNDGSTDDSLSLCYELQKQSDNILVIDKENSGVSDARNIGIEKSSGDYIQFVDSDDYIENNMSERLVELLETNQSDTVICSMVIQKEEGKSFKDIMQGIFSGDDVAKNLIKIYKTNYINSPCNKLYKRSLIKTLFDKKLSLGEDLLFNLKYLDECGKVVFVNEPMYIYDYVNENSLIHKYREDSFEIATKLYGEVIKFAKRHFVSDDELMAVREVYINSVFYSFQDLFYYSDLDKKQKKLKVKKWISQKELEECICNSYEVSRQQSIFCKLVKKKTYGFIKGFFVIKKFISSIR